MTLEQIYERMKKENPYYNGSQAQKEEEVGMVVKGNTINHTTESSKLREEYNNQRNINYNEANDYNLPIKKEKRSYEYINIPHSSNKKNFNNKVFNLQNAIETPSIQSKLNNIKEKNTNSNAIKEIQDKISEIQKGNEYNELLNWLNTDKYYKKSLLNDTYNEKQKRFDELNQKIKKLNNDIDDIKKKNIDLSEVTDTDKLLAPLNSMYTGVQSTVRGIGNAINRISGNENLLYEGNTPEEYKSQKVREKQNGIEKVVGDISQSAGQMAALAPLSAVPYVGKYLSLAGLGLSSAGESYKQAVEEGKSDKEALKYGAIHGVSEAGMQKLLGGVKIFGESVLGKATNGKVNKILDKVVKSDTGKNAVNYISDMLGEGTEEYLQSVLEPVYRNISFNENNKVNPLDEEALYSGLIGSLSAGVMNVPSYIKNKNNVSNENLNLVENTLPKKVNNEQKNGLFNLNKLSNSKADEIYPTNNISKNQEKSTQVQNAPLNEQTQIEYDSKNFSKQIDEVKNGVFPKNSTLVLLKNTPKVLKDIGLNDLPITMTQKHLETISQDKGKYKNANYHNLGIDVVKQLPEAIANPLNIYKSSTKDDSIVLVTHLSDKKGNIVLASIKVDGKGTINGIVVDANHMTSAYGKDNYDYNIDKKTGEYKPGWAELNKDNMIYDIDEGIIKKNISSMARFQLPRYTTNDSINNIIPQNENYASSNQKVLNSERKHYKTIQSSNQVGETGKKAAKSLLSKDTYVPASNEKSIDKANKLISIYGEEGALDTFLGKIREDKRITHEDIALGERLIQIYSSKGNIDVVNELIQNVAILGTEMGQSVQAMSLINRMSPEGQVFYIQKVINRINNKEDLNIEFTKEQQELILSSKTKKELENNISKIGLEIAEQMPIKLSDKLRSWRYLSMLGNPRTHIRNILANVAMKVTQGTKNKVAGFIEGTVSIFNKNIERTKTIMPSSKSTKKFASKDVDIIKNRLSNGDNNVNIQNIIKSNKRNFKGKVLNGISKGNSNLLELEDWIFLKSAYKNNLANYMTANNLTSEFMESNTSEANKALEKARSYAVEQAQEATFRKFSQLANDINRIENRNILSKVLVGGLIPFKKTPINIAKAGVEYSPLGLAKSISYDTIQLSKGKININKYIDNISKGLTGTSIALLGAMLANMGILKAGGEDDDKKEKYSENLGLQTYSIKIGDNTYTIDWLSPSAMPLFVGAEFYNSVKNDEVFELNKVAEASLKTINPLVEMSMLQSFVSSLKSFDSTNSTGSLADMGMNMLDSYINQYIPSVSGQIARTIDNTERDTYTDKTDFAKRLTQTKNKILNKIPFASKTLQPKTNIWGNEEKREENILFRFLEQNIAPYYKEKISNTNVDNELNRLYNKLGEGFVIPKFPKSKIVIDKNNIKLSPKDYTEYKKYYGTTAYQTLDKVIKEKTYNQLSDKQKANVVKAIYSDVDELSKENYAKKYGLNYERSSTDLKVDNLVKNGLKLANAYIYKGEISKIQGDKDSEDKTIDGSTSVNKAKYILNMRDTDEQKDMMLSLLTDTDTKPTVSDLKKLNGNYLTYMQQSGKKDDKGVSARDKYMMYIDAGIPVTTLNKYYDEIGDIEGIKNSKGKTISGSKKKALFNYINSLSLNATQKKILFTKCNSSYGKNYKSEIHAYINSLNISKQRKEQIWNELYD